MSFFLVVYLGPPCTRTGARPCSCQTSPDKRKVQTKKRAAKRPHIHVASRIRALRTQPEHRSRCTPGGEMDTSLFLKCLFNVQLYVFARRAQRHTTRLPIPPQVTFARIEQDDVLHFYSAVFTSFFTRLFLLPPRKYATSCMPVWKLLVI